MTERDHNAAKSRRRLLVRSVLVFGVGIPAIILAVLYGVSEVAGFNFGNAVFGLSIVTAAAWMAFSGWGHRMDAARPLGELLRSSATDYGRSDSEDADSNIPRPARLLVVLTGTVVLGWTTLILTLLIAS